MADHHTGIRKECPVTGFFITATPEFENIKLDRGCHCTIHLVGKRIINIALSGEITLKSTRRLTRLHEKFIRKMKLAGKPYVEIRDCSNLTGLPPEESRSDWVRFLQKETADTHLYGVWLYQLPNNLKSLFQTGIHQEGSDLDTGVVDTYKEAITRAVGALRTHKVHANLFEFSRQRVEKEDWIFERDGYKVIFEIIGDNIIYSEPHGELKPDDVEDLFSHYVKVIKEAGFTDGRRYYRILNWAHFKKGRWRARKEYVRHARKINKRYPSSLSVVFGMNPFLRMMLALSKPFVPFEVISVDGLDQALEAVEKDLEYLKDKEKKDEPHDKEFNLQVETYKNQLLKFIRSLAWDQKGIKDEHVSDTHPLKEIFDAIAKIKADLDAVFEERNKVESRLKQSQEKYRNILENMEDGYYEVDLHGNFLFFNETLLRLLGYTKAEFGDLTYRQIIDKKTIRDVLQTFESVYRSGNPEKDFGYELISKSGHRLYGETSISLMRDVNGRITGFRGVVRDRTEKKSLEDELIRHRNSLEKMITLRTKELEEETTRKNHIKKINTSIFNISNAVNATHNLNELYGLIHQYLNDIIEMPNFYIGIYNREKDIIDVPYHADQYDRQILQFPKVSKKKSLSGRVVMNRAPLFLSGSELTPAPPKKNAIGHTPKNWMGVPLVSQKRTIGIMAAQSYTDPDYFNEKDLEVLISVSNQVAMAIERRQALDDLHEREKKYRKLIETTSAGYWQVDENDRTVDINRALCDMIGYLPDEIMGKTPFNFLEEQSKETYRNILLKSHRTPDSSYEITFITRKGKLLYSKVDATSIFDKNGVFKGSFAFITDITKRIRSQQELRKTKETLEEAGRTTQTIIDNLQAGVVLIHAGSHTIELVNPAAADMFGAPSEQIIGKRCHEFLCPAREGRCPVTDLDMSVDNSEQIMCNVHKEQIPILKTVNPIVLNQQQYLLESFVDITEQKKAENRLIDETERANAMAKAAEAASQAKSEFLANMSHEIRTPLNGVIGMAELLLESKLENQQKTFVRTIGSEADSLLGIINTILDFSKIEAGKMELEDIRFNLRKLFEDFSAMMDIRAAKKGLDFFAFLDTDIPAGLFGDPGRLRQVFVNLVGNALKFTSRGTIFLKGKKTGSTDVSDNTVTVRFEVVDTGIGISKEKQSHIFESFSQADGSTTREYGGTGLGTTISKQLVEMMGGRIGVESEINKGSVFWFEIPFKKDKQRDRAGDLTGTRISGTKILVVATRETDRFIIARYLESFGCRTVVAKTGKHGLHLLGENLHPPGFDMILADFNLASTDGFSFAESVRKKIGNEKTPIVLMTSMGTAGDAEQCRRIGINGYLHKPVKKSELQMTIASTLGMVQVSAAENDPQLVTRHFIKDSLHRTYQILVVEDYPTNQQIAVKHLTRAGFKVILAENGFKAVSLYKKTQFDIVLMDIQMPEMDGYEATREIRRIEAYMSRDRKPPLRTPIIAMTAHAMKGYREKCLAADMDDYLTKPLKKTDLTAMVEKWCRDGKTIPGQAYPPGPDNPGGAKPIDLAAALEEFDNDEVFLNELLEDFIAHVKNQIRLIRTAIEAHDFETIEKTGHSIKGGAANLTASHLSEQASKVEASGKEKNLDQARNSLVKMETAFTDLCDCLVSEHPDAVLQAASLSHPDDWLP